MGKQAQLNGQEQTPSPQLLSAALFSRFLEWRLELFVDDEVVVVQLVHTSHMKGFASLGQAPQPLVEQFTEEQPAFVVLVQRSGFTSEEQIRTWFASLCTAFDINLHGVLAFEMQRHFSDLVSFQLDLDGIRATDKNQIIEEHIEGRPTPPGVAPDIGTREFLRILLAARGRGNESPANEFNLPWLIGTALRNLHPSRLLTYEGVNTYLKDHYPGYAAANGESLRKRCKACGVDFVALVRKEQARRKAEN